MKIKSNVAVWQAWLALTALILVVVLGVTALKTAKNQNAELREMIELLAYHQGYQFVRESRVERLGLRTLPFASTSSVDGSSVTAICPNGENCSWYTREVETWVQK